MRPSNTRIHNREVPECSCTKSEDVIDALCQKFRKYAVPLSTAILLSVTARGQTIFSPLYSFDRYEFAYVAEKLDPLEFSLPQGRFGLAVIFWLRGLIGYDGTDIGVSSLILAVLFFAAAGIFFAKIVLDNPTKSELSIFLAIMTLHPFGTEFFTFSDATLNIMIGLLFSAAGSFLAARSSKRWVSIGVATLLLVAALSIYQTTIAYVLPLCLIALVVRIIRRETAAFQQPIFQWPEFRALIVVLASVVVYLALAKLISHISGVPLDGRTNFAGLIDVKAKLGIVWTALTLALWPMPGLLPAGASILLIALLSISTMLMLFPMLRNGLVLSGMLCATMLAAGLGWAVGASAIGKVIWLVPRVLAPVSAFAAGLIMVGWHVASPRFKAVIGIASALLVMAYIGSSNRILSEQHRLNHWDAQQANRIVNRLERHPRFVDIRSLAIIGGDWRRSARLVTTTGDMNVSAFFSRPSKLGLIQEASGYRFEKTTSTEYTEAEQYCLTAPHFPAEASVTVLGSVGVVCLAISK